MSDTTCKYVHEKYNHNGFPLKFLSWIFYWYHVGKVIYIENPIKFLSRCDKM